MIRSVLLARVLEQYGFSGKTKMQVPEVVWRGSEACVKGYLRALFQCDGTVTSSTTRTAAHDAPCFESSLFTEGCADAAGELRHLQRASVKRREAGAADAARRQGRQALYCKADYELMIG
jgi:ribonucleoside-diphosphate reductase alpha chain